jgi:hypothetical protein
MHTDSRKRSVALRAGLMVSHMLILASPTFAETPGAARRLTRCAFRYR